MINVYLIDDDADDREIFELAIQSLEGDYLFFSAMDGEEGLQKLNTHAIPKPDVIFLDLNMPKVDGRQFLKTIKLLEELRDIPVYMYSTSSIEEEKTNALQNGAAGFMTKHYTISDLKRDLEQVFGTIV